MSKTALGQAIREAREAKGISLRKLAAAVGLSAPFMSDLEHGRRSTNKLPQIAKALGLPVADLQRIEARVDADLKRWIEENPDLVELLHATRAKKCRCLRFHHAASCPAGQEPQSQL